MQHFFVWGGIFLVLESGRLYYPVKARGCSTNALLTDSSTNFTSLHFTFHLHFLLGDQSFGPAKKVKVGSEASLPVVILFHILLMFTV